KVLLARWLATAPRLLVLDEPTRGIDVGAKAEIQKLVADLAAGGMSVVFISAELEEVLRLSHRIAVLRDRRTVAEIDGEAASTAQVVDLIAGGAAARGTCCGATCSGPWPRSARGSWPTRSPGRGSSPSPSATATPSARQAASG